MSPLTWKNVRQVGFRKNSAAIEPAACFDSQNLTLRVADETPEKEPAAGDNPADEKQTGPTPLQRQRGLTREQRLLLQKPRSASTPSETLPPAPLETSTPPPAAPAASEPKPEPKPIPLKPRGLLAPADQTTPVEEEKERKAPTLTRGLVADKSSAQRSAIVIVAMALGILILLAGIFFIGRKFDYWRYKWSTRKKQQLSAMVDKYPNLTPDELIESAYAAERAGKWADAGDRFIAAKKKNLALRGILYRVGRIAYQSGDLASADAAFERAVAFGEDVDKANFSRGLVALRRRDYAAAERFFDAASAAAPLVAEYYYFAAESMRLSHKPNDAIDRYHKAAARAASEQDFKVCHYKIRLARMEAAEMPKLSAEIEAMKAKGPLSVDWVLTAAAIRVLEGKIEEATQLILQAKALNRPRLFVACSNDTIFKQAGEKHPDLAAASKLDPQASPAPTVPAPMLEAPPQ